MTINRDLYLNQLIAAKRDGFIKIITGIRRCGKSYLLFKLFKQHLLAAGVSPEHIIEVDLEKKSSRPRPSSRTHSKAPRSRRKDQLCSH